MVPFIESSKLYTKKVHLAELSRFVALRQEHWLLGEVTVKSDWPKRNLWAKSIKDFKPSVWGLTKGVPL